MAIHTRESTKGNWPVQRKYGVIREIEKARYGENSFFRLCEQGLFREPRYEGDYVNQEDSNDDDNNDNDDGDDESGGMAMSNDEMVMSSDE